MNTTKITVKDVCRLVCDFAMKTSKITVSASEMAHVNGHTFEHPERGPVSVAAHWSHNGDDERVYVNVVILKTGGGYAYRMNREHVWDDKNNEISPNDIGGHATLQGIAMIVQEAMDAQNEIVFVNSSREAIPD